MYKQFIQNIQNNNIKCFVKISGKYELDDWRNVSNIDKGE